MRKLNFGRLRWLLPAFLVIAALGSLFFGVRAYRSLVLLQTAYEAGAPPVAGIRPWMTLGTVADTYGVSDAGLVRRLALPPTTERSVPLGRLARNAGLSPFDYVQRVQRAVLEMHPRIETRAADNHWLASAAWGEASLSALLLYGYAALGLILLLGGIGVPLPTGVSTAIAGSLAAQGDLSLVLACAVAVPAAVAGDLVGYGLGRLLGEEFLQRRGHWFGYSVGRRRRVEALFERWGVLTVLLTRTLASAVSPVVNLAAGASRYGQRNFVVYTVLGRALWISAYLGLGYGVVADLDAATGFLSNLTGLVISLAVCLGAAVLTLRPPALHRRAAHG